MKCFWHNQFKMFDAFQLASTLWNVSFPNWNNSQLGLMPVFVKPCWKARQPSAMVHLRMLSEISDFANGKCLSSEGLQFSVISNQQENPLRKRKFKKGKLKQNQLAQLPLYQVHQNRAKSYFSSLQLTVGIFFLPSIVILDHTASLSMQFLKWSLKHLHLSAMKMHFFPELGHLKASL